MSEPQPTGLALVDGLAGLTVVSIDQYIAAASQYVRESSTLTNNQMKAAQIRLSLGLARALVPELQQRLPTMSHIKVGEIEVAGGLRSAKVDVCELHPLDGLRLAVELKPVNLAVGRALWNRFGDIRATAVNIHLKFPFAVVGGVLAIPTYEAAKSKKTGAFNKPTITLINRAIARLARAGSRRTEGDAAHLLEGVAVVVYDPDTATMSPDVPAPGSGLRWSEFVENLVVAYEARFIE